MKLYNKTKWPTGLLRRLLALAGRSVGARTGGVVVKVTENRGSTYVGGGAHDQSAVYRWHLARYARGRRGHGRVVRTDGGWVHLVVPQLGFLGVLLRGGGAYPHDGVAVALDVYKTAQHEFAHIRDYQHNDRARWAKPLPFSRRGPGGRRPAHGSRPEEQRAKAAVGYARRYGTADDLCLELAEWLEGHARRPAALF